MAEELAAEGQPFKYENGRWDFDYDKINSSQGRVPSPDWTLVKEEHPVEAAVYGDNLDLDAIAKYNKRQELKKKGYTEEEIIKMLGI